MGNFIWKDKQFKSLVLKWIEMLGCIGSNIRTNAGRKLWHSRDCVMIDLCGQDTASFKDSGKELVSGATSEQIPG